MRSIPHCTTIGLGRQHIQLFVHSSRQRSVGCCVGQQCFHWSVVHGGGICLGIRRWWLVSMAQCWHIHQIWRTSIGCMARWIPKRVGSMVGKRLIRWSIGGNSWLCIFHGICIRSFHRLFLCTRSPGMQQLVAWFQSLWWLQGQMQLKRANYFSKKSLSNFISNKI